MRLLFVGCLLLLVGVGSPGRVRAQARLNLGLEAAANRHRPLLLWAQQKQPGVEVSLDTSTYYQGRSSLRVQLPAAAADDPPYAQLYTLFAFPVDSVRGRTVTVSAWVQTSGFTGRAGVYAYAHTPDEDGKNRSDSFDPLPPTQPWRRLEVSLPVKATATAFGLGLRISGSGQVWFDDVQVRIDGRLFKDAPQPGTEALLLTADELQLPSWDGEQLPPPAARPDPARVALTLDSAQVPQGRRYLRLATPPRPAGQPRPLVYLGTVGVEKLRGKLLTASGRWRQPDALAVPEVEWPTFTYTLLGSDGRPGSLPQWSRGVQLLSTPRPGPAWGPFTLTVPVPDDEFLAAVSLGVQPGSAAVLELDDIRFSLDGRPYVPAPPAAPAAPTAREAAWLRRQVVPLPAAPATGPDLLPLAPLVGAAQVVGLGEVTHGSGSVFRCKARLVRYLIEQHGFTTLALETSADCHPLNDYLQTGQGDPTRLLAQLGVWNTREVLELLRYLRGYNQQHRRPVQLAGIDMQRPDLVLAHLQRATPAADDFAQTHLRQLAELLAQLPATGGGPAFDVFRHPDQPGDPRLQALLHLLAELRTGLDTRAKLTSTPEAPPQAVAAYLHDLRLLEQGLIFRRLPLSQAGEYRDACLAENVEWVRQHLGSGSGPARVAVWAHNAHVATAARYGYPMGYRLRATLGAGYLAVGFAFGAGTYAAENGGRFAVARAQPARPGTYEAWFAATGLPAFVLDLRPRRPEADGAWLTQQQLFRDLGIQEAAQNFAQHQLPTEFDCVVFLQQSVAAERLP